MAEKYEPLLQLKVQDKKVIAEYIKAAKAVVGEDNVSDKKADLLSTCRDYWPLGSIWMLEGKVSALPDLVAWPANTRAVSELLALADRLKIPVIPFGEGSGALGGTVPLEGGIMLDLKRMNRLRDLDETNQMVTVESGINGARYEEELNKAGYTGGHFPQSLRCSTVGGWLACRAAGQFSTRYGKIEDIAVSLEAVLADGTIFSGRSVPRTATGPRPDHLFIGSEGTLGIITEATLRIWPLPEARHLVTYTFENMEDALQSIRLIMRTGARPAVVRLYDPQETGNHFPELGDKRPALIILIEGVTEIVQAEAAVIDAVTAKFSAVNEGARHVEHWLERRFNISAASRLFQKDAVLDTIEVTTNWHNAFSTYQAMQKALLAVEGTMLASGHYSHVYPEGAALYLTVVGFPGEDKVAYYKRIWSTAMKTCIAEGAAISHHHGIGLHRGLWMEEEHGAGLEVLRRLKKALDPNVIMNPGKLGLSEVDTWRK